MGLCHVGRLADRTTGPTLASSDCPDLTVDRVRISDLSFGAAESRLHADQPPPSCAHEGLLAGGLRLVGYDSRTRSDTINRPQRYFYVKGSTLESTFWGGFLSVHCSLMQLRIAETLYCF